MSIDLLKNPTGPGQACYKCGAYFLHAPSNPRGRQCNDCRLKARREANHAASPAAVSGHTKAWAERSLGAAEAAALARVWGQAPGNSVTGD